MNDEKTTGGLFVVFQPFGIFREPAFQYPFALVEHFEYPPKGRERYDTENNTQVHVFHIKGQTGTQDSRHEESPPASGSEIVFALGDHRVKDADDQKGGDADDDSGEVVLR